MKRIAAIDIGSNSVRLALSDGTVRSVITKLADGIESSGALSQDGKSKTLTVLKEFAEETREYDGVTAFATEAIRRAADGEAFCAEIKKHTGLSVKILTGEDEARLALFGAVKPRGAVTVCDLGGGSMELISSADGITPDYIKSLPLGVVVLKNKFRGDYGSAVDSAETLVQDFAPFPERRPLVIIGGSICSIAAAAQNMRVYDKAAVNGYKMTFGMLDGLLPMLMSKDLPVFRPICAKRADTIAYGAIIIRALLNVLNMDSFTVSDSGNLDAVLSGALDNF